jgi:hypothetical protein
MVGKLFLGRRLPFALIAVALLCGPQVVSAAPLRVASMLSNFQFDGDAVDYSPDLKDLVLRSDSTGTVPPAANDAGRDLQVALFVDDDADVLRVAFNTFGSLPPMLRASESELLKDSIQTMEGGNLQFIADTSAVSGPLARRYRAAAIYMTVAGLDVEDWLRGYAGPEASAKYNFLEAAEGLAGRELAPGMPAPPTLFLFLATGIALLLTRRRG